MKYSLDIWISQKFLTVDLNFFTVYLIKNVFLLNTSAFTATYINVYIVKSTYMFLTCSGFLSHDLFTVLWSSAHFH